jgi:nitrogen fixation/metabolism regulation signal transduction histidine kinase
MTGDAVDHGVGGLETRPDLVVAGLAQHDAGDRRPLAVDPADGPEGEAVENPGEKLTPQLAATLAEPFLRGTKRIRTDHAGVGLGLAIVKSITHAHDGTLTLTPRGAGGLRVTVRLPAAP